MLLFDRHGSGRDQENREDIERDIEEQLFRNGWQRGAACAIVIDPELEAWIWASSPVVGEVLGWGAKRHELRDFLERRGLWDASSPKPNDPKEAFALARRQSRRPGGARIFARLAEEVSLRRCQDPAFIKFRSKLSEWFSASSC